MSTPGAKKNASARETAATKHAPKKICFVGVSQTPAVAFSLKFYLLEHAVATKAKRFDPLKSM